jgi:prepilin-type N-terminal cleavage/methylation domain-containing protein
MTKNKNHKAFSLIEISMVILVIGILIAGVSQGVDLYDDYRLASARNLTKNSLVNRIPDLEMWLETTSENSLATGTTSFTDKPNPTDQDSIGRWNNINPNILPSARNHATQNNPTALVDNQPKYIRNGINGLPALKFDGTNDFFSFNGNFLVGSDYTIFVVEARGSGKLENLFFSGTLNGEHNRNKNLILGYYNNYIRYEHWYNGFVTSKSVPNFSSSVARIHNFTFSQNFGRKIYVNSSSFGSNPNTSPLIDYPGSSIGRPIYYSTYSFYEGFMLEMIFYSRALTDKERQGVETYLSKKWGIKLG